jgi:hypothetical protein
MKRYNLALIKNNQQLGNMLPSNNGEIVDRDAKGNTVLSAVKITDCNIIIGVSGDKKQVHLYHVNPGQMNPIFNLSENKELKFPRMHEKLGHFSKTMGLGRGGGAIF